MNRTIFVNGRAVELDRLNKKKLKKGTYDRHIIMIGERDGVEVSYHATKGWRRRRVGQ